MSKLASICVLATLVGTLAGCEARHVHDEVFFSCSAERPECPKDQSCNPKDNCCHPNGEDPNASLGQCLLAPGLSTLGSGIPGQGSTATSGSQSSATTAPAG